MITEQYHQNKCSGSTYVLGYVASSTDVTQKNPPTTIYTSSYFTSKREKQNKNSHKHPLTHETWSVFKTTPGPITQTGTLVYPAGFAQVKGVRLPDLKSAFMAVTEAQIPRPAADNAAIE